MYNQKPRISSIKGRRVAEAGGFYFLIIAQRILAYCLLVRMKRVKGIRTGIHEKVTRTEIY